LGGGTRVSDTMKLSEWANVAEIASAVAVAVSLVYLGVGIRQNTTAIKASTHQAMLDYGREQSELLISNPEVALLVAKAESSPGQLNHVERAQFYEFTVWRLSTWETAFLNHRAGLIDTEEWNLWDAYFRLLTVGKPGYEEFWRDNRSAYDREFTAHVDEVKSTIENEKRHE
jgi:hypothetical protein